MSVNGMLTILLSESLVHVMFGVGLPSARHCSVTFPPSITVWYPEISVMFDGTAKEQRHMWESELLLNFTIQAKLHFILVFHYCFSLKISISNIIFGKLNSTSFITCLDVYT